MSDDTSSQGRVLVIDDEPSMQTLVGMLLDRVGIPVTSIGTAIDGLRLLETEDFDLLILDLMLPDIDGLELLEKLRQDSRFDKLSVLILSARSDPEAIGKAMRLGADGYLTKPYVSLSLTQRVTALLAHKHGRTVRSELY
ncbi:MAG: response regulator [Anaerolineae bacterium]|nr:response regulator [Anaerolineae bacterium]